MGTEDTLSQPPLASKDEKEAQKVPDLPRKNGTLKATQGKTLWDWLDLIAKLAVPLILGIATLLLGIQQTNLAQQQHAADQNRALDQQRQATLVTYLDNMNNLLLNKGLLASTPNNEVSIIARTETLSAIRQLDATRNSFLVQFLQDSNLIGADFTTRKYHNIVSFVSANLSSTDLSGADLYGADIRNAQLDSTNLSGAILIYEDGEAAVFVNADLHNASLESASLSGTAFDDADLSGAHLDNADLSHAEFNGADLSGASLESTNLSGATFLTQQQLDTVSTCKGATLPQGLTCNQNQ
jgi:uncharacterized protein YjbI with pentapeptide repeats